MPIIHQITASALDRFMACPGSVTLPWREYPVHESVGYGKYIHRRIETALVSGVAPFEVTPDTVDEALLHVRSLVKGDPSTSKLVESSYGLHTLSGFVERIDAYRSEDGVMIEMDKNTIVGTADVVIVPWDHHAIVIDWKTGKYKKDPEKSWQMRFLSLCTSRLSVHVTHIIAQLVYLGKRGIREVREAVFTRKQLDSYAEQITEQMANARSLMPDFVSGEHCRFCPARENCEYYDPANLKSWRSTNHGTQA